ncbi:MAG TPA: hypothetical protein VG500_20405 [Gemmatimonadales bacterium]|jgi:hypothetical protein|nr:hypothetical protein [Gemmatimonadales bacterium]
MISDNVAIVAVFGIAAVLAVAMLLRPAVSAWARRIAGEAANPDFSAEMAEIRQRLAELEGPGSRLQELEERMEFAERLLAQRNEPASVPLPRTPEG